MLFYCSTLPMIAEVGSLFRVKVSEHFRRLFLPNTTISNLTHETALANSTAGEHTPYITWGFSTKFLPQLHFGESFSTGNKIDSAKGKITQV